MRRCLALADAIDRGNDALGRGTAWLAPMMALFAGSAALLRESFALAAPWTQDAVVWGCALMALLGAGYTLKHDAHVRIDPLYRKAGPRRRALIDLFGVVVLLAPALGVLVWFGAPYVARAWASLEASPAAGGLPGLFLIKSMLLAFCAALLAQALALAIRCVAALRDG